MKVTRNDDGTVTVSLPKTDEVYDPESGALLITETLSDDDFAAAIKKPKKGDSE